MKKLQTLTFYAVNMSRVDISRNPNIDINPFKLKLQITVPYSSKKLTTGDISFLKEQIKHICETFIDGECYIITQKQSLLFNITVCEKYIESLKENPTKKKNHLIKIQQEEIAKLQKQIKEEDAKYA